jgi:hypothetical protein
MYDSGYKQQNYFEDLLGYDAVYFSKSSLSSCLLVVCLSYCSVLKKGIVCSFETSVNFFWTTWCHIPEDRIIHIYRCERLKSNSRGRY